MLVADLLKRKMIPRMENKISKQIRFTKTNDSNYFIEFHHGRPCLLKTYKYKSEEIENKESKGIKSTNHLFHRKLRPLVSHIIFSIYQEATKPVSTIEFEFYLKDRENDENNFIQACHIEPYISWIDNSEIEPYSALDCSMFEYENAYDITAGIGDILNHRFSIFVGALVIFSNNDWNHNHINDNGFGSLDDLLHTDDEDINEVSDDHYDMSPPEKTYIEKRCAICLVAKPNILFLDCMHIAICDVCEEQKREKRLELTCDICRSMISRRLKIDYNGYNL